METEPSLAQARLKNLRLNPHKGWYRFENRAKDNADVYIYDELGMWGLSDADFVAELNKCDASNISVHLNSPGGDYFAGVTIANAIRSHKARVTMHVDGLAASAASVIAMAGDEVLMHPGSQMMIHDALSLAVGNAAELRETANLLDRVSDDIAGMYAAKAGGQPLEWRARMQAETWYSAKEAVEAGLANGIAGQAEEEPIAARWDLSIFKYQGRDDAPDPGAKAGQPKPPVEEPEEPPMDPRPAAEEAIKFVDSAQLMAAIRKAVRG